MVGRVRSFDRTGATPVLVVTDAVDGIKLDREFAQDRATMSWNGPLPTTSSGPRSTICSRSPRVVAWARRTPSSTPRTRFRTLATIARSRNAVFDIEAAKPALLEAMGVFQGQMRLMVADVVALIGDTDCQRTLVETALSASDADDQVYLLGAAADNAQSFGNRLDANQVAAIRKLISDNASATGAMDVADAAGRLYGAPRPADRRGRSPDHPLNIGTFELTPP